MDGSRSSRWSAGWCSAWLLRRWWLGAGRSALAAATPRMPRPTGSRRTAGPQRGRPGPRWRRPQARTEAAQARPSWRARGWPRPRQPRAERGRGPGRGGRGPGRGGRGVGRRSPRPWPSATPRSAGPRSWPPTGRRCSTSSRCCPTETIERQGKVADAQAEARLKATEQLMAPVRESLDALQLPADRGGEGAGRDVAPTCAARSQAVQQTGETLRRETARPGHRAAQAADPRRLGRDAAQAGRRAGRHDRALRLRPAAHDPRPTTGVMRPDMRVNLAEGKHVFVDAKVPLSAFLEARRDRRRADQRAEALQRYAQHVRTHVDQLSRQAVLEGRASTPEFVVLFLPSEAFFAAALDQIPDLYDYAAAPRRRAGHPDHADRHAARGGVRLEAGGAGRERGRGVPAGPRPARPARPDGQPAGQARPGAADLGQRLQRDHRHRRGHASWSGPASSATSRSASRS